MTGQNVWSSKHLTRQNPFFDRTLSVDQPLFQALKDENRQQTQPTFEAESGNRTQATLVGGLHGKQMLNHCAIPTPRTAIRLKNIAQYFFFCRFVFVLEK